MTPAGPMRALLPTRLLRAHHAALGALPVVATRATTTPHLCDPHRCSTKCRCLAHVKHHDALNRDIFFTDSSPTYSPISPPHAAPDHEPPDKRTLQLGKTVRTLHDRLPTLLQSPLPSEILSPQISLHLFPSTHPHLPTVSGRLAYIAALWTAPVAWGRIPLVGNVGLTILSERMVRHGGTAGSRAGREEKLIVKWKTCGKTKHRDGSGGLYRGVGLASKDPVEKIRDFIGGASRKDGQGTEKSEGEAFCGIFVFEFDEEGRVVKHVIENTEEGGQFDRMTRVVSVTDWLLGHFNGKEKTGIPALACCDKTQERSMHRGHRGESERF